jgi:hypothetical protein
MDGLKYDFASEFSVRFPFRFAYMCEGKIFMFQQLIHILTHLKAVGRRQKANLKEHFLSSLTLYREVRRRLYRFPDAVRHLARVPPLVLGHHLLEDERPVGLGGHAVVKRVDALDGAAFEVPRDAQVAGVGLAFAGKLETLTLLGRLVLRLLCYYGASWNEKVEAKQ